MDLNLSTGYDGPQMQSFLEGVERERERREAGKERSTTSTESPTAAMAKLAMARDDSTAISLSPGKPPSLPASPSSGGSSSSGGPSGSQLEGSVVLAEADDYFDKERGQILDKHKALIDKPVPPPAQVPSGRGPPPFPNRLRKRNLSGRNAPLVPPLATPPKPQKPAQQSKEKLD